MVPEFVSANCSYPEPNQSSPWPNISLLMGPCHNGLARTQVADGGAASNMDGNCEYIE